MYRNELSSRCESVKLDTRRACAVKLSVNDNVKLLIVCVYMPYDSQLVNQVNVEYEEVIHCVEGRIQSTDCNGVLLCGDWNTSFERDNDQTKSLNEFIDRCNVKVAWKHIKAIYDNCQSLFRSLVTYRSLHCK